MKCECGAYINPWDIILPWRDNYKLLVVDDNGTKVNGIHVCYSCYCKYQTLIGMIAEIGIDGVINLLNQIKEDKE